VTKVEILSLEEKAFVRFMYGVLVLVIPSKK